MVLTTLPTAAGTLRGRGYFSVRVLHVPERLSATRNFQRAGTDCQGELIIPADQDDIWLLSKRAIITNAFQRLPDVAYVFSDAYLIDEKGAGCWRRTKYEPPGGPNFEPEVEAGFEKVGCG
jgi:hypothetical protein